MLILYNYTMKTMQKTILITLGFGLATYLIMSGMAMLNVKDKSSVEMNTSSKIHADTMK